MKASGFLYTMMLIAAMMLLALTCKIAEGKMWLVLLIFGVCWLLASGLGLHALFENQEFKINADKVKS